MKKTHIFFFLLISFTGLAFTGMSKSYRISPYSAEHIMASAPADSTACDTVSFNARIMPVFLSNCVKCHEGINDYKVLMENADHILKSLKGEGAVQMPKDAAPLHDTIIRQFSCWIAQGKLNN